MRERCGERPFIDAPSSRVEWPGLGQVEFRPLVLTSPSRLTQAEADELAARWAAQYASQPTVVLGGPAPGELAEKIAAPIPPIVAACRDCRTVTELDWIHRCPYCAELAAIGAAIGSPPRQAWPGSPRLTACAVVLLAAMCASLVLGVPAAAVALLALAAGGALALAMTA